MVLDVYLWESQIQNMKYETNLATCIISKIPNLRNEFDYDCNKSKHRNVTVIWFFFSLILCCLLKHILEAYRFRSFIHTNLQRTYVQRLALICIGTKKTHFLTICFSSLIYHFDVKSLSLVFVQWPQMFFTLDIIFRCLHLLSSLTQFEVYFRYIII